MTDAQMITLCVAILAVFAGTLFNNSRITDLRDSVNRRFDDFSRSVDSRFDHFSKSVDSRFDDFSKSINQNLDHRFALLSQQMKSMEDNLLRLIGDHETRLQKLEQKPEERRT